MPSKLVIELKNGDIIESQEIEHKVNMAGDLIIGEETIPAKVWSSVRIEEVKKATKAKPKQAKEKAVEPE